MTEHIGTITAAGQELSADKTKKVFKLHLDNPKYTYTLFDDSQKMFAEENIGGTVKVTYVMSSDEKHRNVESLELATEAQAVASNGRDAAIATQVAAKIVTELWISDKLPDDNLLVIGLKKWLGTQLNAWPEQKTATKESPVYKDTKGNDPSKATTKNIAGLKDLLEVDDEGLDNEIALRFGYDAKMSDAEAKDWIKELKTQVPPF